jgi:hypothetical protein
MLPDDHLLLIIRGISRALRPQLIVQALYPDPRGLSQIESPRNWSGP